MDAILDAIQDVVTAEPGAGEQPGTAQPDDGAVETRLAQEISELWSSHVRLSGDRKVTSKELRLIRARLAQRLHEMKAMLAHPGRGGEWRGWLRERGIPRSTADRLVTRYAETLEGQNGNCFSEAIPEPAPPTAQELANGAWHRVGKALPTDELVIRFIGCIAEISGVKHERRDEGLVIFNPVPKTVDGVTGSGVSAEVTCPAPLPPEGDANPADAPATEQNAQPSDEVSDTATQDPAAEIAVTSTETAQPAAAADAGESDGGVVAL
jgi:hypothetical protein